MRGGYKTEQKQTVSDFFLQNKERHFTVDEVLSELKSDSQPISRSTVYRQINSLFTSGFLRRFESQQKSSFVYQYADNQDDCMHHYHMKCTKCGRLLHIHCPHLEELSHHFENEHNFIIGKNKAVLYGECKECVTK